MGNGRLELGDIFPQLRVVELEELRYEFVRDRPTEPLRGLSVVFRERARGTNAHV